MGKGSPIIAVRIPEILLRELMEAIRRRNRVSPREPWDRTAFIVEAIKAKLSHLARSRAPRRRKEVSRVL